SLPELATYYLKQMRKIQSKGPYHIAGYSFGACVGFEMGLQLQKMGEQVVLTLIDGSPDYVKYHSVNIGKHANEDVDVSEDGCR
ncbi:PREDICTED: fatty acid synthase-like, partial [Habropoda laboriosa]